MTAFLLFALFDYAKGDLVGFFKRIETVTHLAAVKINTPVLGAVVMIQRGCVGVAVVAVYR